LAPRRRAARILSALTKVNSMNASNSKLNRLFGPRALASTVATGLLVASALASGTSYVVWSVSGYAQSGFCPTTNQSWSYPSAYTSLCSTIWNGGHYYWCCLSGDGCGTPHYPGDPCGSLSYPNWIPCDYGGGVQFICTPK
jgi:hypothetical protein